MLANKMFIGLRSCCKNLRFIHARRALIITNMLRKLKANTKIPNLSCAMCYAFLMVHAKKEEEERCARMRDEIEYTRYI